MSSTGHLSELDLLRSQVADMSHRLTERDRVAQDLREQSEQLRALVEGTAAETGEEFFASLVTHLTSVLNVQYAVIGEVQGDRVKKIRTLAVSAGGALVDNFEYDLAHTPCATALTQTFAFFDRGVQATFPQFQRLVDLGAESYCAVPLRAKSGAVIGLLVVMDTKPLEQGDYLQSLLGVFAPRIAAEFERRRAEQERAQALADLHNVIETIPDIVFALNTQGNLVKWNRRLRDVTGYSPEELLNKPALAFVPPEEQTATAAAIQRAFTEGYAELDGHLLTKDLRTIPYHWTGALLKNLAGEPACIAGVGRDVSDQKREEAALYSFQEKLETQILSRTADLKRAQQLLQDVIDSSPDWIFVKDLEHRFLLVNRSFAASQGLRPSEMHGHVDSEFWPLELCEGNPAKGIRGYHADDREAFQGKLVRNEYDPATLQDGRLRIFDTYKGPLWGADGGVYGALCYARDMTEQQEAEAELQRVNEALEQSVADRTAELEAANEALRVSEARLRAIFDHAIQFIGLMKTDGTVIEANRSALKFAGIREEDVIGKLFWDTPWWTHSPELQNRLREAVLEAGEGRMARFEATYPHPSGELAYVDFSLMPVRDEQGNVTFLIPEGRDITERKRIEDESRERDRQALVMQAALFELARFDGTEQTFSQGIQRVTGIVADTLAVERLGVWLFSEDRTELVCQDLYERSQTVHSSGCKLTVLKSPRYFSAIEESLVVAAADALADPRTSEFAEGYLFSLGISSMMDVPIRRHGKLIGVVCYEHVGSPREWSPEVQGFGVSVGETIVRMLETVERRQAQAALVQSERQLRTVLDALPVGIWFTDQSGKPILTNPVAKQIWSGIKRVGIETGANAAGSWEATGSSNDIHRWALSHTLTKGVPALNQILKFECLDGTAKTIRNSTVPVLDEAGVLLGAIVLNEDITLLRQAQEALKLTQFSVDHAVEAFLWVSRDARILHVNDAGCRLMEYTNEELTAMTWTQIFR
jgi:PAS domain S-box-containing protein